MFLSSIGKLAVAKSYYRAYLSPLYFETQLNDGIQNMFLVTNLIPLLFIAEKNVKFYISCSQNDYVYTLLAAQIFFLHTL